MASVPGHVGFPIVGDKSLEFLRDAILFVDKRMLQHESRVFSARFLNKTTVFVASNEGVRQLLNDNAGDIELGYKAFMHQVYGDNILFSDGEEARSFRNALHQILTSEETIKKFDKTVESLTEKYLGKIDQRDNKAHIQGQTCTGKEEKTANGHVKMTNFKPCEVYKLLKKLATEICLTTFLDTDFESSAEIADQVVSLTTTHWHGIISVPINLKFPMMSQSTFGKALNAKAKLLDIINDKLGKCCDGFPKDVKSTEFGSQDKGANHVLLFTSALVPKAIASILTSFVLVMASKNCYFDSARADPQMLDFLLLEVMRVWPPLAGGRRIAKQDTTIDGFKVSAGHAVVYMTHHAQRDPAVFIDPDDFQPSRWAEQNAGDRDKLFVLGSGPRDCIGKHLVWKILKVACRTLVNNYTWGISDGQEIQYKWLPVTRPRGDTTVSFTAVPILNNAALQSNNYVKNKKSETKETGDNQDGTDEQVDNKD